jgi:hypothetical protein
MKRKIGLAFAAAAIGCALVVLAQASVGLGNPQTQRASGGVAFGVLQPVW